MQSVEYREGQRWISESEPELGLGTLVRSSSARVSILFTAVGELREYSLAHAPIKRVRFREGDTVKGKDEKVLTVESVHEVDGLITYRGKDWELPEAHLSDKASFDRPQDRLFRGKVDTEADYRLRQQTLIHRHDRRKSPVRGFLGGRIDLIPHQLYIASEVSSRQAPRVLLSDEVGLGKTIEASLILHRLLLSERVRRVLVLVPESLVHQWFVEMFRRFNIKMSIFDEERCAAIEQGDPEANPFLDDQLILCSLDFLSSSPARSQQAVQAGWDLLIVDEAHHLEWSPEISSPEYELVETLSRRAEGLLLLTATPEQLGEESHFARLRLLDPERYSDFEKFIAEPVDFRMLAEIVDRIREGKKIPKKTLSLLQRKLPRVAERLESVLGTLSDLDEEARLELVDELLDLHGPGRVIFRNTRAAMSGFPPRKLHSAPLKAPSPQPAWIARMVEEFESESGRPVFGDLTEFGEDPRVAWLMALLKELGQEKVLLICRHRETVAALAEVLRLQANLKAAVFHEGLTLVQRDRNAAWFAEPDGVQLLICSEIGSEGRNFQFVHHLVLFDLPLNPELMEQRIGRLDRIGQREEIKIHVPYLEGSPQEVIARWYHEGLDLFESNLVGGNELLREFASQVRTIALETDGSDTADEVLESSLKVLLEETAKARARIRKQIDEGRDRLLEMNSFRPESARSLVAAIEAEDEEGTLEAYMIEVFERFGVTYDGIGPSTYRLALEGTTVEAFPSLREDGMAVTFDRERALAREDVTFLSWDHPMVTGAMDLVLGEERGNSGFGILPDPDEQTLLLEATFVVEAVAEGCLHVDRFLPATPLRVVVNFKRRDVTDDHSAESFAERLVSGSPNKLIQNSVIAQQLLPSMIRSAGKIAGKRSKGLIAAALEAMNRELGYEQARLKSLMDVNDHVRPDELDLLGRQQLELSGAIEAARVRLDSIRLIWHGHPKAME
ncbi:MAG: RNA polymerase-associated protein RapA [Acidobacteriota bacterium]|nr:MAG: RNA polymerase-associated protein RapA [Acidobacteriota bacterium]